MSRRRRPRSSERKHYSSVAEELYDLTSAPRVSIGSVLSGNQEKATNDGSYNLENDPEAANTAYYDHYSESKKNVESYRIGLAAAGLSASSIGWISQEEASHGDGTSAAATFNTRTKQISMIEFDQVVAIAEENNMEVSAVVEGLGIHEGRHRFSDAAEGSDEVNSILVEVFDQEEGEEVIHNVEEGMASDGTTNEFDIYDEERGKAASYARHLRIGVAALYDIKLRGDHKKLREVATDAGLIKADPNEPATNASPKMTTKNTNVFPLVSNLNEQAVNDDSYPINNQVAPLISIVAGKNNPVTNNLSSQRAA